MTFQKLSVSRVLRYVCIGSEHENCHVTSIKHVQSVCVSHERWTNAECNAREKHVTLTAIN